MGKRGLLCKNVNNLHGDIIFILFSGNFHSNEKNGKTFLLKYFNLCFNSQVVKSQSKAVFAILEGQKLF